MTGETRAVTAVNKPALNDGEATRAVLSIAELDVGKQSPDIHCNRRDD